MKNKTLLLLASVALLAGCGRTSSTEIETSATEESSVVSSVEEEINNGSTGGKNSSSKDSSTKESSSKESSVVITDKLAAFFDNLSDKRAKVKNLYGTSSSYFSMEFYGEDGYFFTGSHSKYKDMTGGVLNIPSQGVWKVVKDSNKNLVLDGLYQVANATDWTKVNTEYTGYYQSFDSFVKSYDLWESDKNAYVVDEESEEAASFLDDLPGLARYLDGYSYGNQGSFNPSENRKVIASNVSMSIDSKATKAVITFDADVYEGETRNGAWSGKVEITADGSYSTPAEMTALQTAGIPDLTAWPTDVTTVFDAILGEQIPFVDGISGAAYFYMPDASTLTLQDPFSGDLTSDFQAVMTSQAMADLGWAASGAPVTRQGMTTAEYERVVKASSDTNVAVSNVVTTVFFDAAYFTNTEYDGLYPNGVFFVDFAHKIADPAANNVAQTSDFMSYVKKADGTTAIPALNFGSTTIESLTFDDLTADQSDAYSQYYGRDIIFSCWYELEVKCATDEDAKAAVSAWLADIAAAGFVNASDSTQTLVETFTATGTVVAGLADSNFVNFQQGLIIEIDLGKYNTTTQVYDTGSGYFSVKIAG